MSNALRICAWNVHRGTTADNWAQLTPLSPDIAILPECARPSDADAADRHAWTGDDPAHGLGIACADGWRIEPLELDDGPAHSIGVRVSGPETFNLVGVWTLKSPSYVQTMYSVLDHFGETIREAPTVIAGDFNTSCHFDEAGSTLNHAEVVRRMKELELVSAYHLFHGECHGDETRPTYYHQWKEDQPFHIDYCFVPADWSPRIIDVSVGGYEEWSKASDHRPLLTTLSGPAEKGSEGD